ncbi:MAG TPA: hypothetical protein VF600_06395 [Abditibacteriaceae bacterium]|jgi:hypothetical protein
MTGTTAAPNVAANTPDFSARHNGLTINGAVGNPLFPTAQIPARGSWRIQGSYYDMGNLDNVKNDSSFDENFGDMSFYGLHAAGRPWTTPLEVSIGVEKLRARGRNVYNAGDFSDDVEFNDLDKAGIAVGAKYLFTRETDPLGLRIAGGAGFSQALLKNVHAYLVGTKSFQTGRRTITTHLGVRYDRFKFTGNIDESDGTTRLDIPFEDTSGKVSLYGGVEVPLDRRGQWNFVGEAGTRNSEFDFKFFPNLNGKGYENSSGQLTGKFPYSLSLRYANQGWSASAGVMRQGLVNDSGFFAQLGKTF